MINGLKKRPIQERVIIAKTLLETILDDLPSQPTPSNTLGALDCVDRQAAINAIEQMQLPIMRSDLLHEQFIFQGLSEALAVIKELPSAEPFTDEEIQKMQDLEFAEIEKAYETGLREGRKKGKWIIDNPHSAIYRYACSECHAHHRARYDFCPSCGSYNGGKNEA